MHALLLLGLEAILSLNFSPKQPHTELHLILLVYQTSRYDINVFYPSGLDTANLLSVLTDELSECLPDLTPVQRWEISQFLTDICTTRRRLFQAVVAGAKETSAQIHLEVQLPPNPCPLVQARKLKTYTYRL